MDFKLFALLKKYIDKRVVDSGGLPAGGSIGQLLGKTQSGTDWIDPPSNVNPDYEQNDETAPDYIKNRPGGYDKPAELFKGTVEFPDDDGVNATMIYPEQGLSVEEGQTYRVLFDGVEYVCVAGRFGFGDDTLSRNQPVTDIPFYFMTEPYGWFAMPGSHEITIYGYQPVKIPERYLQVDTDIVIDIGSVESLTPERAIEYKKKIYEGKILYCRINESKGIVTTIEELGGGHCSVGIVTDRGAYEYSVNEKEYMKFGYVPSPIGVDSYVTVSSNGVIYLAPDTVKLPSVTASDAGKFLRVSADGSWVAESIPNAEEGTFG